MKCKTFFETDHAKFKATDNFPVQKQSMFNTFPAGIYLHKVNNRNTRKRCEICSKLTIKTPKRCQ